MRSSVDRYHRQMLLPEIGQQGQAALARSHALVAGCGALGSVIADMLARAGVGRLTLVDRDLVELTNLQRQTLYDERDVAEGMPKAEAARRRLSAINSTIEVRAIVDDVNRSNIERFALGEGGGAAGDRVNVILDGLDNFETRYLLNDVAVREGIGYVYGGAVATHGMTATFLPHAPPGASNRPANPWPDSAATPCLRCVFEDAPPPGSGPTCDTAGVLGSVVAIVANLQVVEAIKILTGRYGAINRELVTVDVWRNEWRRLDIASAYDAGGCPCCMGGRFEHLAGRYAGATASLCGRDAVQIVPATPMAGALSDIARRLEPHGRVELNRFLLRAHLSERAEDGPVELTLFPNGRAIVKGTTRPDVARGIYAKYVGA